MRDLRSLFLVFLVFAVLWVAAAVGQERRGTITGRVTDASQGVLPGARVELQPTGKSAVSDGHGDFTITDITPGKYALKVSYVGFEPFSTDVNVTGDAAARVDAVLQIGTQSETVTVRGERERGEVEAINIERTADNIIQVLPNEVITSLPNTNIADAVGRLPSVSLERDEGEGKYIQIRGTEPRLSNVTINGIHVPSPEGVRNVKLDVIPADLVDMVEISKTLSANQDADAIGGSVNLVTKSPTDKPYVTVLGMGGYTPISGGRKLYQFDATAGQRFGTDKKFGLLFGGSYDFNARGIDDLEPAYGTPPPLVPNTEDLRNYHYDRTRYGFDGEGDYKLGDMSSVYLRGLFAKFRDFGEDWIYSPGISNFVSGPTDPNNTCGITTTGGVQGCGGMGFTDVYRKPGQQIFSVQAGARHALKSTLITYELALSQAHYTGGYDFGGFAGPGSDNNSVAFGVDTKDPFVPKFPVLNGVNIYDPTQYHMTFADAEKDSIFERDVVGDISLNKQYSVGSHYSSFEVGFKGWDAAKTSRYDRENFNGAFGHPMTEFLSSFRDNNYYFKNFTYGPVTDFKKILAALQVNGTFPNSVYNLRNSYNIGERIWAGYVMNTISLGRLRLQTGVRIESTKDSLLANQLNFDPVTGAFVPPAVPLTANNSYVNAFPSVQAQYRFGSDTILRASYGMGIARPNFGDMAPYQIYDPNSNSSIPITAGNPNLKPTHAQNFDVLIEHYLKPLGLIQGGVFYKALSDPIYTVESKVPSGQYQGLNQLAPINGPHAHIAGVEMAWQQRLTFLPGALNGMGVQANYSYTTSRATFPNTPGERTDHPTLVRTAPNNWNFDVTYDKKGFSARMGLTHNDGYIWSYAGAPSKGPSGDTYLYPHTQVDAQVSYWIPRGHGLQAVVSMLNLNNEVFGFYNGSEQFPIQREYYSRTISAGLRWTLSPESK
jgi:TonB-dependent receptor